MFTIPILVPVLAALGILVSPLWCISRGSAYEKRLNLKKFGTFLLVTFIATGVVCGLLFWGGSMKMYFKEVWNNKVVKIRHEEEWTEEESRTRQVPSGTDSKGNTTYRTETYYVTEHYGPYWKASDDQGATYKINSGIYNQWMKVWASQKKVGVHKGSAAGWDKAITGNIYECRWPDTFGTIYPWATVHRYKNKVRMSDSVLKYAEPTEDMKKRYPRPADTGNTSPWVNYGGTVPDMDVLLLQRVNAKMGAREQIHTLLVTFGKDSPRSMVDEVLTAWQGPNKNELVTFIALDGTDVKWCEVHSWMDNTTLHATLRDTLSGQRWSTKGYADALLELVPKHWRRKEFEDFNYLKVSIHGGWILAALIVSLVIVVVAFLVIDGRFDGIRGRLRSRRPRFVRRGFRRKRW